MKKNRSGKQIFYISSIFDLRQPAEKVVKIFIPEYCCGKKLKVAHRKDAESYFDNCCNCFVFYSQVWKNRIIDKDKICKKEIL